MRPPQLGHFQTGSRLQRHGLDQHQQQGGVGAGQQAGTLAVLRAKAFAEATLLVLVAIGLVVLVVEVAVHARQDSPRLAAKPSPHDR